jgi:hypothetical protein
MQWLNVLFFFPSKTTPLVTSLSETCCWCTTYHSWLVGDMGFYGVVIFGENTSDKQNHFLNKISRICFKNHLFALVLLETGLVVFF